MCICSGYHFFVVAEFVFLNVFVEHFLTPWVIDALSKGLFLLLVISVSVGGRNFYCKRLLFIMEKQPTRLNFA